MNSVTLSILHDAVSRDVLLHEFVEHSVSTLLRKTSVDGLVTSALVSVTSDSHLSVRISVEEVYYFLYLHHFRLANLSRVDEEEHVASERFCLHRSRSGFWSRCRSGLFYGFWSGSHRSRNYRYGNRSRELTKTEGETTEEVGLPVYIVAILRVELVVSHRYKTFDVEAYALAEAEVYVSTEATSRKVEGIAVPNEEEFIGRKTLSIESFLVVEAMDVTCTNESVDRNATVGVVTCEEVREVKHTIETSSHIVPLVILRSVVVVPAVLTFLINNSLFFLCFLNNLYFLMLYLI